MTLIGLEVERRSRSICVEEDKDQLKCSNTTVRSAFMVLGREAPSTMPTVRKWKKARDAWSRFAEHMLHEIPLPCAASLPDADISAHPLNMDEAKDN